MDWKTPLDRLKQEFNDNPTVVIGVLALAATAASKLGNTAIAARNSNTWAKEVKRRNKPRSK